jgi:hypothetical protein
MTSLVWFLVGLFVGGNVGLLTASMFCIIRDPRED